MCPHCIKLLQRKAQRRLISARDAFWKNHQREIGKCERFVTLTGPTLQGVSVEDSNRVYNRAFLLLADTAFWSSRVDAGAKHVEFTINRRGYHTHCHLLIYGSYIERDQKQEANSREWRSQRAAKQEALGKKIVTALPPLGNLQDEWTRCLTQAARELGREIEWKASAEHDGWYSRFPLQTGGELVELQPTSAAKANVHVCIVREKGRPVDGEIGLHSAVKELTKYITKASSWSEVSDEQLVAIAEVKRWPRCFELLGAWRNKKCESEAGIPKQRILRIGIGETWEAFCRRIVRENGHPDSYVIAWDQIAAWDMRSDAGTLYAASGGDNASLDTDSVFRTSSEPSESPPPEKMFKRPPSPSLMELGERMNFEEWLKLVSIRLADGRRARARLLAKKYPDTRFYCLDGSEFGGAIARIANSGDGRRQPRVSTAVVELRAA
jgi:hypothetical protein